jgi:hypothetical protein
MLQDATKQMRVATCSLDASAPPLPHFHEGSSLRPSRALLMLSLFMCFSPALLRMIPWTRVRGWRPIVSGGLARPNQSSYGRLLAATTLVDRHVTGSAGMRQPPA